MALRPAAECSGHYPKPDVRSPRFEAETTKYGNFLSATPTMWWKLQYPVVSRAVMPKSSRKRPERTRLKHTYRLYFDLEDTALPLLWVSAYPVDNLTDSQICVAANLAMREPSPDITNSPGTT